MTQESLVTLLFALVHFLILDVWMIIRNHNEKRTLWAYVWSFLTGTHVVTIACIIERLSNLKA